VSETGNKSIKTLTDEQKDFYQLLRIRATSEKFGQPYIAYAIFKLIPINAPGLKTMGVDEHYRVYIDFDYMMEKGLDFASKVLNHEPWHLLRSHNARYREVNATPYAWNIAGDMEINDDIKDKVPSVSVFPSSMGFPDNQTAEYYLEELKKKAKEAQDKQKSEDKKNEKGKNDPGNDPGEQNPGNGGKGEQPGDGQGQDGEGQGGNQPGDAQGAGKGTQPGEGGSQPGDGSGSGQGDPTDEQGNGAGGSGDPTDEQGNGAGGSGDPIEDLGIENETCVSNDKGLEDYKLRPEDAETVSEFDQEMISREVAQETKNYAGRKPGSVPAGHKLWADEKLAPTPTPWQKVLRGAIRSSVHTRGQVDYVKSRPNRRQPVKGILLPALRAPKPRVGIGVDTSGSHVPMLPRVLDEVHTIIKKVGVRGDDLKVFSIDTRISGKVQTVSDARKINLAGGGGTDMMPAFNWARENKKDIDVFILFTDGEIPSYPAEPPTTAVRFVVCILHWEGDAYGAQSFERAEQEIGDWAKVVHIEVPQD